MKKVFLISLVSLLFCSAVFAGSSAADTFNHDSLIIRDGSSFKKAIIISDTTESAGVDAEYRWIALHYPDYSSTGQSLNMGEDKRPFDIIYISNKVGDKKEVFFDISNYFGKW